MSNSHATVGKQFGKLKACNGSRMGSAFVVSPGPHNDDMAITANKLFYRLQEGISYRTTIAKIMRNVHTKTNELWVTPQHYSSSTERHKGYFRAGFIAAGNSADNIFVTPVIDQGLHRHHPSVVHNAIGYINNALKDVDKPRLREATRRGTIDSCIHYAKRIMHNFTHGIPLDELEPVAYYDMQATMDFLTTTQAIADIDEVRAAVKGYLALLEVTR
jgi:hypothetical protein